ncbi:allophanate hydrolase [Pseudothauera rhizosphaerae]|uniref:Allophanate hydrolase n=1 Tax=Pseudothauera rhizosphaerae TaxID=2565932 RepID=A0A4V3WAB9_9RHOO|nr:allophanate hydrolase [Pseudothauera rhizosphaerae]THF58634.1 allophanate hydrolase [Pseudothauera rhizosphaerae]
MQASRSTIPSPATTLDEWRALYRNGRPVAEVLAPFLDLPTDDPAWIACLDPQRLQAQLQALAARLAEVGGDTAKLPLYGVPFAVKDNIDVAGWPTTAACPAFAYVAKKDAGVVARLRAAGAIVVGKTNLDQFATGLVGVRSPHGAVPNSFDPAYVSGGSSSGSASVVARGLVPFSLGTDTAGSGRVPAAFNNIVGLKPSRGWLSTAGVVPACRTLDCVSVFALTVSDAAQVAELAGGSDAGDPYSRAFPADAPAALPPAPRLAVPASPEFFGDAKAAAAFERALGELKHCGAELVPIDFSPFAELAALLYQGPWVAERLVAVEATLAAHPEAMHPVVRGIVEGGRAYSAADTFKAEYRRAALAQRIAAVLAQVDALVVPSTPTIYTIAEVEADPLWLNSRLGTYTNFTNLADLAALALPAGMREDGLPAGITLIAPAWHDRALADFGRRWEAEMAPPLGATGHPAAARSLTPPAAGVVRLAVVGAHLSGMPLNHQLSSRRAAFVERTHTSADYRLYALAGTVPPKPGLAKAQAGAAIEVELWDVPLAAFGSFVAEIPPPLGIGTLSLADGREVKGFICEARGLEGARDITEFGGWRAYLASLKKND